MTVLMCGSLGSTTEMWEEQLPVLDGAVVVEYPGHGTEPVWQPGGLAGVAERALREVAGRFSFIGLSLGGAVGMWLAAAYPERVERLVLACTSTRFGEPEQWHERASTVRAHGLDAIVDAVMTRWFGAGFPGIDRYRAMFLSVDAEGYARCCEVLAGVDATPCLGRIEAPTLVVAGSDDPTSPPAEADLIARGIAGARVAVIDGAHHLANAERPADFNRLLKEFL